MKALKEGDESSRLDMGCVAAHGTFTWDEAGFHTVIPRGKPATAFLFELIAGLQELATVPMIDVRAYAKWLGGRLSVTHELDDLYSYRHSIVEELFIKTADDNHVTARWCYANGFDVDSSGSRSTRSKNT